MRKISLGVVSLLVLSSSLARADIYRTPGGPGERALSVAKTATCGGVTATTLFELCSYYTTQQGYVGCLAAGKDAALDACALGFCSTYTTEAGCTGCIETIRDKTYTAEEIAACTKLTQENFATQCMSALGTELVSPLNTLQEGISTALDLLDEGKYNAARLLLKSLIE